VVIVRLKGGLGNQFFQYATGYSLSKRLGCELKLDISFYEQKTSRAFDLGAFSIESEIATERESIDLGAPLNFENKLIRKLKLSPLLLPNYLEESKSFIYDARIDLIDQPIYLDGYWQNLNYFEQYREELSRLFVPRIKISEQFEQYLDQIKASQSVSIHVRRGDYVNDPHTQSIHGTCDLNYYKKAIEFIGSKVKSPTYFIFSDDIDWCVQNFDFLKDKVYIGKTTSALEDFQLMRNCQSNIIANSTFSWWAAWLTSKQNNSLAAEVVLPSRWLKNTLTKNLNLNFNCGVFF
jgi:hypothetical protein